MTTEFKVPRDTMRFLGVMATAGALVLLIGAIFTPIHVWSNLLVAAFYLLTMALGGVFLIALSYICGAGWSVAFRRIPEAMAGLLPIAGAAMLGVLLMRAHAYGWQQHGGGDPGTMWFKAMWLTPSFWILRSVVYVGAWVLLAALLISRSRRQDRTGDAALTVGNVRLSALVLAVYAVTLSLASVDWMMALEPLWFSTMWGVYNFAGMIQSALAMVVLLGLLLRRPGQPLHGVFRDEHLHDLGKLLLGFSCFWMYIWFSQYMLIWYTNIPEETSYFITRTQGPWGPIVVTCILLNWVVPFFALLPKPAKRSARMMMRIAIVVMFGRWLDLYLMVVPSTVAEMKVFAIWEGAAISIIVGAGGLLIVRAFAAAGPVPVRDPYLAESLHYHVE